MTTTQHRASGLTRRRGLRSPASLLSRSDVSTLNTTTRERRTIVRDSKQMSRWHIRLPEHDAGRARSARYRHESLYLENSGDDAALMQDPKQDGHHNVCNNGGNLATNSRISERVKETRMTIPRTICQRFRALRYLPTVGLWGPTEEQETVAPGEVG